MKCGWKLWMWTLPALGSAAAARADVIGHSEWEVALLDNPTGLLAGLAVLVLFGFGTGCILYGVHGVFRTGRKNDVGRQ